MLAASLGGLGMRFLFLGLLGFVAACSAPLEHGNETELEAKQAQIEQLERRIIELRAKEALTKSELLVIAEGQSGPATAEQRETFGPLADLVGKRFKSAPADGSKAENPDIQSWSWALGRSAILIRHALADGSYGGDTYVYKDADTGKLFYVYITNAGFRTGGVMTVNEDGSFTAEEDVQGHPTITKVRATSVLLDDGSSTMNSEYFDAGEWTAGRAVIYSPTDESLPRLKSAMPPPSVE